MLIDILFALRLFSRRPVVAMSIVLTLAIAIGASGAVFSVIDAVLLHPVAVADADRVFAVTQRDAAGGYSNLSLADFGRIASQVTDFEELGASITTSLTVTDADHPIDVVATLTTPQYFQVLGVPALLGRVFTRRDSVEAHWEQEIVLSHAFWRTHFGGIPDVVGRRLRVNSISMLVIGVMPERFTGASLSGTPDLWAPISTAPAFSIPLVSDRGRLDQSVPMYAVVGRLRAGVNHARTLLNLEASTASDELAHPTTKRGDRIGTPTAFRMTSVNEAAIAGDNRGRIVQILTSVAALVGAALLLACLNVASILTSVGHQRAAEFGTRIALGVEASKLYRQLFTESLILALPGAFLGILVAMGSLNVISHFPLPGGIDLGRLHINLNASSVAFMAAITVVATLLFGTLPARQATRLGIAHVLRQGHSTRLGSRTALLTAQVAIGFILLVGAGLFVRSARAGLHTDLGFSPEQLAVLSARAPLDGTHLGTIQPFQQLLTSFERYPRIQIAFASHVPLEGSWRLPAFPGPLGAPHDPRQAPTLVGVETISSNYFRVLGTSTAAGREFDANDIETARRVIIINESAARALFPGESPLERLVTIGPIFTYTVVGVVRDMKYLTLQDTLIPFAYVPMRQGDLRGRVRFVARSDDPHQTLNLLKQLSGEVKPALKAMRLELGTERIASVLRPQRVAASLLSWLAFAAMCITAIGVYGTVAYTVSQRTAEIGIRLALGAPSSSVMALVVRQCGIAVAIGLLLGLIGSAVAGRFVSHVLFRVQPMDWISYMAALGMMSVVAIIAAIIPGAHAVRIDAIKAIRSSG